MSWSNLHWHDRAQAGHVAQGSGSEIIIAVTSQLAFCISDRQRGKLIFDGTGYKVRSEGVKTRPPVCDAV